MDRGAWRAPVHSIAQSDMTEATWHARTVRKRMAVFESCLIL